MEIIISKKGWLRQKYHAKIVHQNGNILFQSENYYNLKDVEDMINNFKKDIPKSQLIYSFRTPVIPT